MQTLEATTDAKRALVFGLGGSGDIVGSIPTARFLETNGVEVILGGLAWEPPPQDPQPGPRSFATIEGLDLVSETVGIVTAATRTTDAASFTETTVAEYVDNQVVLLDITKGLSGLRQGINTAANTLDIDLVVGVDAGGDALAHGNEPGLRSPIADGLGVATLTTINPQTMLGVIGYGSDGELTHAELQRRISAIASRDGLLGAWGITPAIRDELTTILEHVQTEASRIPVTAATGTFGSQSIRNGAVTVEATPLAPITMYFDPEVIAATSDIVTAVEGTTDLAAATAAIESLGIQTEFESEQARSTTTEGQYD